MDFRIDEQTQDVSGSQRKEGLIGGFSAGIPSHAFVTVVLKDGTMSTHSVLEILQKRLPLSTLLYFIPGLLFSGYTWHPLWKKYLESATKHGLAF